MAVFKHMNDILNKNDRAGAEPQLAGDPRAHAAGGLEDILISHSGTILTSKSENEAPSILCLD